MRFRTAVTLYLGCVVLFFVPYWGMGQVMAPSCRSTVWNTYPMDFATV
jgi:hypothetical protein